MHDPSGLSTNYSATEYIPDPPPRKSPEEILGRRPTALDLPYLLALGYDCGTVPTAMDESCMSGAERAALYRKRRAAEIEAAYLHNYKR